MSNVPVTKPTKRKPTPTRTSPEAMYRAANILFSAFENARFAQKARWPRSLADCIEEGLNDGRAASADKESLLAALAVLQTASSVVARRIRHGTFIAHPEWPPLGPSANLAPVPQEG